MNDPEKKELRINEPDAPKGDVLGTAEGLVIEACKLAQRAGYDILAKQTDPSVSWLQAAREDLVAIYEALHRPAEAERYRKERASAGKEGHHP